MRGDGVDIESGMVLLSLTFRIQCAGWILVVCWYRLDLFTESTSVNTGNVSCC